MSISLAEMLLVPILGAAVGIGELVSRYRDAPARAIWSIPALTYILLNVAAAVGSLLLIHAFDWRFGSGVQPGSAALIATRVLVAGFGSMALFRSSLFVVRVGSQDVSIGPSSFLQMALSAADRAVDRFRAQDRAESVGKVMEGLSFEQIHEALPTFCLALMQNLPEEDQKQLANKIILLQDADIENDTKVLVLGLELMNAVGPDTLEAAVASLKRSDPPPAAS